ncbi:MAG: ATP-binding protein [Armatimonadetes bacterium]|nr:ATP-binding protein [Armatimonadota bacterium]
MKLNASGAVSDLASLLAGEAIVSVGASEIRYRGACLCTTISEALRYADAGCALVMPLGNPQVVRAASLLRAAAVVVCGGTPMEPEAIADAKRDRLPIMVTSLSMECCERRLLEARVECAECGTREAAQRASQARVEATFPVLGRAYLMAGQASRRLRALLEAAGVDPEVMRRACIATYEAEMNICIYAVSGSTRATVEADSVEVCVTDRGPGIPDLDMAMRPGYSTAPERARVMGFGAGMGLPNIARCCDELAIEADPAGGGTTLRMRFRPRAAGDGSAET